MNGPKVFAEIATFLKASLDTDPSDVATGDNIEEVYSSYGDLYLLLNYLFSFTYNINNQKYTIGEVRVLKEGLELFHQKWLIIGASLYPQCSIFSISCNIIEGYNTMVKDFIERAYQRRHRISYKMGNMKIQA